MVLSRPYECQILSPDIIIGALNRERRRAPRWPRAGLDRGRPLGLAEVADLPLASNVVKRAGILFSIR